MAPPVRRRARARGDAAGRVALALLVALAAVVAVVNWLRGRGGTAAAVLAAAVVGGAALTVPQLRRAGQRRRAASRGAELQNMRSMDIDRYHTLNQGEFEDAIAYLCGRDGCREVRRVSTGGDFGGVGTDAPDITAAAADGRRVVIRCRRFGPGTKVGVQDVQRFGAICFSVQGADVAAVVTTSVFTGPAVEYADRAGIRLVDGQALAGWVTRTGAPPWR
jgi:restriction system protein